MNKTGIIEKTLRNKKMMKNKTIIIYGVRALEVICEPVHLRKTLKLINLNEEDYTDDEIFDLVDKYIDEIDSKFFDLQPPDCIYLTLLENTELYTNYLDYDDDKWDDVMEDYSLTLEDVLSMNFYGFDIRFDGWEVYKGEINPDDLHITIDNNY